MLDNVGIGKKWNITLSQESGVAVVHPIVAQLDFRNSCEFEETLADLIREGYHQLVVDLELVKMIDSCGLGAMIDGFRKLDGIGHISLCHLDKNLTAMMRLTRLEEVFHISKTREEAIASIAQNAGNLQTSPQADD